MSQLIRILPLLYLCVWGTGCIEDHAFSTENEAPLPPDVPPMGGPPTDLPPECDIESPECDDGQICVVVPRCVSGHVCPDVGPFEECLPGSYVCDEVVPRSECVQPLSISDECTPASDRCGDGLACQLDDQQCGSSCAPGQICDNGCSPVYTCRVPRPPCDVLGEIEACSCAGGAMGQRYCGHDMTWRACDWCDAPPRFGPDDGQCYRCLNDASGPVECSETVDHSDGTRSCVVGDGVPQRCFTAAQCCMTLGREIDSSGTCVLPDFPQTIEFIRIEGGTFQMGGDGDIDRRPIHAVTVPTFEMSKTEVTVGQYRKCVNAGACTEPSRNWENGPGERENHPVVGVDWNQAKAFAQYTSDGQVLRGARLPTEAEWEYAARSGGQDIVYPWGNEEPDCERLNIGDCVGDTTPVCSYAMGNTVQGLCDMAGNVYEWVEDDYHLSYEGAPVDGVAWVDNPRSSERVGRGGSLGSDADQARAAYRDSAGPSVAFDDGGFRLARSLPGN